MMEPTTIAGALVGAVANKVGDLPALFVSERHNHHRVGAVVVVVVELCPCMHHCTDKWPSPLPCAAAA